MSNDAEHLYVERFRTPRAWNLVRKLLKVERKIHCGREDGHGETALRIQRDKLQSALGMEYHSLVLIASIDEPHIDIESIIQEVEKAHRNQMYVSLIAAGTFNRDESFDAIDA